MAYVDNEGLPSGFRYNNKETVDTVFSRIVEKNLFKDVTIVPGKTSTNKFNERGGQIYVRRPGKQAATVKKATDAGGLDLVETETADSLVLIPKVDVISRSEKCYKFVEELRASGESVDKVAEVVDEFKEGCQITWINYFFKDTVTSGGVEVGGATRSSNTTASATLAALIADILADRKQIIVNGGRPDTLIVSPECEALFLADAYKSGNAFIPETNESLVKEGKIGRLYGLNVYVSNLIGGGTPSSVPVAGNAPANTGDAANCEYIIYDHETFAVCADIEGIDLIPAREFFGSLARIQAVSGGGVVNPALAYAKVVTP